MSPAKKAKSAEKVLKITQVKSGVGRRVKHREVLTGLGLGKIGRTVERPDTPVVRGMVDKVRYLLDVEELEG